MKEKPQNQTILQFHIFLTIQFFFFFLKLTSIREPQNLMPDITRQEI